MQRRPLVKSPSFLRRPVLVLVVLLLVTTGLTTVRVPMAGAQVDELETSAVYHFRPDVETGQIRVTTEIAVTSTKPDRTTNRGITQYYFTGYYFTLPADAKDVTFTQNGSVLEADLLEENQLFQTFDVGFRRNIFYRQTANIVLEYSIEGAEPRTDSASRVNGAYVGFTVLADPGIETSEFNVYVPEGFEPSDISSYRFQAATVEGETVLRDSVKSAETDFYFEILSLRNDDALVRSELSIDGREIELQGWPGDTQWMDFVTETVEEGIPALEDLVGISWPVDGTLTIAESHSPYLSGYGGWYSPATKIIEVGDRLDTQILLHEVSHVWFNDDLYLERWITEGLADAFSAEVTEAITGTAPEGPRASQFDSSAQPLNRWSEVQFAEPEVESWSYDASWTVTEEILDTIGFDGLRTVLLASSEDEIPYRGEGEAEASPNQRTWRTYLDFLEEAGDTEELDELFQDWILTSSQGDAMAKRSEARAIYASFQDRSGEWGVPLQVRDLMTRWRFEQATEAMAEASEVLDVRDEILAVIEERGLAVSGSVERAYETQEDDYGSALILAEQTRDSAIAVVAGIEAVEADRSILTTVGLIGSEPESIIDSAVTALAAGELDDAVEQSEKAQSVIGDAASRGQARAAAGGGALLVVVLVAGFALRRRKKARSTPTDDAEPVAGDSRPEGSPRGEAEGGAEGEAPSEPLVPVG